MTRSIALPLTLSLTLAAAAFAAKPTDYSTDVVVLEGGQIVQTMKLYVSGQKSRLEGMTAGPLGRTVAITRQDKGLSWVLFPDKRQYTETPLTGNQQGKVDLANFDQIATNKQTLGRETVLGHPCTKMRATMGNLPNGQPLVATVWVADSLQLPLRLEMMGTIQENRNLAAGPQPANLFEIPAGFTKTGAPGMPAGMTLPTGRARSSGGPAPPAAGKVASPVAGAVQAAGRYGGRGATAAPAPPATNPAWAVNTDRAGGDYRELELAAFDPAACKAVCDSEARCKAWTLVKPDTPGGKSYCFLKDIVPEASPDDRCISGLKGAGGAVGGQAAAPASKYQLEMNINRGGEDYRDFVPAKASADLCAEACAKESRCRAWTWVKSDLEPPTGHCWLKNPAPEPAQDDCCFSGVKR